MKISKRNAILVICIFGFILFFNSFFNGFVWDDEELILGNPVIQSLANIPKFFSGGSFNSGGTGQLGGPYYKPIMTLIFSLIYSISGASPFLYHFFQVGVFIASVAFLFLLFEKFFKNSPLSFLLSLIFLVHPFISEAVFYAADLQDVLFFFFGVVYLYLFVDRGDNLKYRKILFFLPLLALLSKETAILFGIITVLYALLFEKKKIPLALGEWGGAFAIYLFMRLVIGKVGFSTKNINPMFQLSFWERMANIPKIVMTAVSSFFYPSQSTLVVNQHWVISGITFADFWLPILVLALFGSVLVFLGIRLKSKLYWLFLTWFVIGVGMHSQVVPLDATITGRWYLFALAGLLGIFGVLWQGIRNERMAYYILVPVILIFAGVTFLRSFDFRSGYSLYSHDIAYQAGNYNLENNLGVELYRRGDIEGARSHFEASIALNPVWWTPYNNLGAYWQNKGDNAKAEEFYLKSIKNGNYYLAIENYASILYQEKKYGILKEFLMEYLKYFPQNQLLRELWYVVNQNP